jgi:enoyl-CoA hydratase/carnithine racemase
VVLYLLDTFRQHNMLTIAGVRGNAAAGGVAFAAACDIVIAGAEVVLNPAYRGIGLYGSEYHTISYFGRCGSEKAREILKSMTPMSPFDARAIGLVDHVFPGSGAVLEKRIRNHVAVVVRSGSFGRITPWKSKVDLSLSSLAQARASELGEMAKDFWSARSSRYHTRRFAFVRKLKATHTPLRFATHRRMDQTYLDEEERASFDNVVHFERMREEQIMADLHRKDDTPASSPKELLRVPLNIGGAKSSETVFSCYYSSPELIATPSGPWSSHSSLNGGGSGQHVV